MHELRFDRLGGGTLALSKGAVEVMDQYRQTEPQLPEGGGILLGRVLLEGRQVVVDRAEPPATVDRRSRHRFVRVKRHAQQTVNSVWRESGGIGNYLGEWHTHPEPDPSPSPVDLKNWRRILSRTRSELAALFFVIVGTHRVRVWEGAIGSEDVTQLVDTSGC